MDIEIEVGADSSKGADVDGADVDMTSVCLDTMSFEAFACICEGTISLDLDIASLGITRSSKGICFHSYACDVKPDTDTLDTRDTVLLFVQS